MRTMVVATQRGDEVHANPSGGLLWVLLEPLGNNDATMCVVMYAEDDPSTYLVVHATDEPGRYGLQMEAGDRTARWRSPGRLSFDEAHRALLTWGFGRTPWRELCAWAEDEPLVEDESPVEEDA